MTRPFHGPHRWLRIAAVLVATTITLISTPLSAEGPVSVTGTSVTMAAPPGFKPSEEFAGFAHFEKEGSFLIAEFPAAALAELSALFNDQKRAAADFAKQGVTIASREELKTAAGATIPLLRGSQEANGKTYDKWMALYGGEKSVMISFQIPHENALDEAAMKAAFASVSTGAAAGVESQVSALPFEIEPHEPFRIVQTIAGTAVLMTVGPNDADPEGKQPMIIAAYSRATTSGQDLMQTAEATLKAVKNFENINVVSREKIDVAGEDGTALRGTADHSGTKKSFVQYFTISDGRVLNFIAMAPESEFEGFSDAINRTAGSISFKE